MNPNDNGSAWTIRAGGLFRCCTQTAADHNQPGTEEGQRLPCPHCSDVMVWRADGRCWESQHAQQWEEEHRASLERRRAAGD